MANPFTCNCHLGWLAEWLKKRNVITGTPTCTAPHAVKNTPIQDLKSKEFVCEGRIVKKPNLYHAHYIIIHITQIHYISILSLSQYALSFDSYIAL